MASEQVAARALARARARGAPRIVQKALIEAGIVESGLQHAKYSRVGSGDRDSVGFLQQRPSAGWGPAGESIEKDTDQFVNAAMKVINGGFKGSAGSLAQAVQRSAFPGRYDQVSRRAEQALSSGGGAGGTVGNVNVPGIAQAVEGMNITQQPYQFADKAVVAANAARAITQSFVQKTNPGSLLLRIPGLFAEQNPMRTGYNLVEQTVPTGMAITQGGKVVADDKRGVLPKGHSPLFELFWQGQGGINAKNGRKVPQGFVDGHTTHVHVAAGPNTIVQLGNLAKRMGLKPGENPHFGGVNPVHVQNSFHYRNEAIDVSGDPAKMREYAHRVASIYGIR